jgi:hypothetical protein
MAVPASGAISMIGIRREIGNNNYNGSVGYTNVSLTAMSLGSNGTINTANASTDRPNGSTPHSMSEFYSYDHDATSVTYSSLLMSFDASAAAEVCEGSGTSTTIYYDSSDTWNDEGTTWYTSNTGQTEAATGYYLPVLATTGYAYNEGTGVADPFICGRSERRLKYNIEFIGDSPMGIPMYHFNYKNEEHGKGRFIGTMVDDLQRLGFEDNVIERNGELWVMYDSRIDVPFESVTI